MGVYSADQVKKWRYKVQKMSVIIDGETTDIPVERFKGMEITHKYFENLYPLIKISMIISSDTYYNIQQNKDKCKFYLRIDKFKSKITDSGTYNDNPSNTKRWLNDTFDLILDENTEDSDNNLKLETNIGDYKNKKIDNSDALEFVDNIITFYLYKTLNQLKTNVNKVLIKTNVTDAICYLMSEASLSNIIMQQPDNIDKYDVFLIPPASISKALYFIDTYYGIYKSGTIFYSDIDYTYILPLSSKMEAYISGQNHETHVIIPKSTTDHNYQTGTIDTDGEINYIVADATRLNISNDSISNDYINGTDSESIDSYSGIVTTVNAKTKTKTKSVVKYNDNGTINKFYSKMQTATANSMQTVIQFSLKDIDADLIKPNNKYSVIFEDTTYANKYKGSYIVSAISHNLIKEGESAIIESTLELRLLNE